MALSPISVAFKILMSFKCKTLKEDHMQIVHLTEKLDVANSIGPS